ncbi:mediator of RNA polymerase II transcription subunit 16 isoform X2 [Pectinophora gossypiella]|uniref:mediator of RNA polymerase II transcription subunit 16 isoform X2 n=1 Tax=Pectinophora gossypiella TaxID=13191 RepID=UPI00214E1B19|nr:mediator of RNA polymerase II transcription subunit 16 isoform X2 [Pectinophora gossypiella]
MELIYSMRRKPLKCEPPHFERADPETVRPLVTISSCNIIAFSSPTELQDVESDTWGGHVYVCDLDTPWDSHKVVSTTHPVSAIEWDSEGRQLLVATTEGEVSVFGQKDFLLNEWTCQYTANFPGERIIKGIFFHNGRRVVATDKKPDAPLTDKFTTLRCTPTLKGFGGLPVPGVCVITSTGLVGAVTSPGAAPAPAAAPAAPGAASSAAGEAPRAMCSLRQHRDHVTHASIAHKNGSLVLAAVCRGGPRCVVRCAALSVSRGAGAAGGAPLLAIQPLPSVCCPHSGPVTAITWCQNEDTDSLLVGAGSLTLWKLTERSHAVHKMLAKGPVQGNTTPGGGSKPATDCFNTLSWHQTAVWAGSGSLCTGVASGRLALSPPHALLATPRKLHLLARDDHHYICSRVVSTGPEPAAASPPKKPKYNNGTPSGGPLCGAVCAVEVSWLGGVAVAVDSHAQLHVYRLPQPHPDIPTPLSIQHTITLLEYSLVSGYDCLDVLLTLKPSIVEAVYERVTESFQRQPAAVQQYYYHSWHRMRIALCRLLPTAASSVSWLTCLSTLWATWAACTAAARVDDRPDDKLLALLDDTHADHDKALLALESKPELPSELQVLSALRRPLQRVVDIAVTALATASTHAPHRYELWADPVGLSLLRKLVVLARGAGVADAALSRLLARLHQPKPDLIEECHSLAASCAARVWEALPRTTVSGPHARPPPHLLEYGVPPSALRVCPEPPPAAHTDYTPAAHMDSIRYMFVPAGAARRCGRCGARALPQAQPARHPLQRAHDARHLRGCRCGGKWTLVSNA